MKIIIISIILVSKFKFNYLFYFIGLLDMEKQNAIKEKEEIMKKFEEVKVENENMQKENETIKK